MQFFYKSNWCIKLNTSVKIAATKITFVVVFITFFTWVSGAIICTKHCITEHTAIVIISDLNIQIKPPPKPNTLAKILLQNT